VETLAELPFIGDQVVCLSHDRAARSGPAESIWAHTIFTCGNSQRYGKPLKQCDFCLGQADIHRVTGASRSSSSLGQAVEDTERVDELGGDAHAAAALAHRAFEQLPTRGALAEFF
jgi:hypothetical protein